MHSSMGLVTLGVGYFVFVSALKEKKTLKTLGQGIGILLMVGAALGVLCEARGKMGGSCPFFGKTPMCMVQAKAPAK